MAIENKIENTAVMSNIEVRKNAFRFLIVMVILLEAFYLVFKLLN